jgi:hypothetical protein
MREGGMGASIQATVGRPRLLLFESLTNSSDANCFTALRLRRSGFNPTPSASPSASPLWSTQWRRMPISHPPVCPLSSVRLSVCLGVPSSGTVRCCDRNRQSRGSDRMCSDPLFVRCLFLRLPSPSKLWTAAPTSCCSGGARDGRWTTGAQRAKRNRTEQGTRGAEETHTGTQTGKEKAQGKQGQEGHRAAVRKMPCAEEIRRQAKKELFCFSFASPKARTRTRQRRARRGRTVCSAACHSAFRVALARVKHACGLLASW